MFVAMTFHQAHQQLRTALAGIYYHRDSHNISALVFEHVTGLNRLDRLIRKNEELSLEKINALDKYTSELLSHKPIQYVLQEARFYGLRLYVDENVLIPRPETEELVDWIVKDHSVENIEATQIKVLDIGTGSGCIALGLKKKLDRALVQGIDISEAALNVARLNAKNNHLKVGFSKCNFLDHAERNNLGEYDIIVSNPPYIPVSDKESMQKNVLDFEPHIALFVDNDRPLIFYEAVADFSREHLKKGGIIYFELHESLGNQVAQLYKTKGYFDIELRMDMQGKVRMMRIRL